ncbi:MAG: hypothetical protein A3J48_01675 [Candidatus Doudnabacteria bacterium RIFCSPHIGHO2_02_FULL_46_11]|uniref:TNase-like domain-containing protein n=1 Tax=Candidatus Doudnabacteria bacterium RIFCSPHIGHO2_02_FULL_46_11 TaxID=1817832 RepID=A0A1F5PA97_9BACT|nr:MAG: hypothetical protein A3J48_01675 [Candidatus Doudnabacteria bacterium RIFCSPHIGHO2_02_FULL_46_11]
MNSLKEFIKRNEKIILLSATFTCVFLLGFFTGKIGGRAGVQPLINIEKSPIHSTILRGDIQSQAVLGENILENGVVCRIKGNISSSSRIYHLPGGSFYDRTDPEMCFNTEAEAQAAGFRKSSR